MNKWQEKKCSNKNCEETKLTGSWQEDVRDFHKKFGANVSESPTITSKEERALRSSLIKEEVVDELLPALEAGDLVKIADGIVDSIYVLLGAATSLGIDVQPLWKEVHDSNMRKDGAGTLPNGKILKPAGWEPPKIKELLDKQMEE